MVHNVMKYIFENENALELYYIISKDMGINIVPRGFEDEVYVSETFLTGALEEIHLLKHLKKQGSKS